jgi:hypothetical protein
MDFDKLIIAVQKVGIIPITLGWLAWEFHNYVAQQVATNQLIVATLQELVRMHIK